MSLTPETEGGLCGLWTWESSIVQISAKSARTRSTVAGWDEYRVYSILRERLKDNCSCKRASLQEEEEQAQAPRRVVRLLPPIMGIKGR
jgi:hypothetical protein